MSDRSRQIVCPHCAGVNRVPADKDARKGKCGRCQRPLFSGSAFPATAQAFDTHLKRNDIPVVVDFWATWCGPCRSMAPAYERVAAELEPQARFLKVDADAEQELAARYNIRSIPTLMMFRNGALIAQRAGASDAQSLRNWVQAHLA
jgi:thioredoxin 2